jgi:TetR/AcrR family transcriptional repressor of nem operon
MPAPTLKAARKARTRAAIVTSAAALARERGIVASSVADVMARAGLTVGGFYAHFESKDALFEAVIRETARDTWAALLAGDPARTPAAVGVDAIDRYLSAAHRDRAATGCLLPSITADVARLGGPHRAALRDELDGYAAALGQLAGGGADVRGRALALIALLYGGLSLARALRGTALSDELLGAARDAAIHLSAAATAARGDSGEASTCEGSSSRASGRSRPAGTTRRAAGTPSSPGGRGSRPSRGSTRAPTPRGSPAR